MTVTITGIFPSGPNPGTNILVQALGGGFGASAPAGFLATYTEQGGSAEVVTSGTVTFWSDTQVVIPVPTLPHIGEGHPYNLSLAGTGLTTNSFEIFPYISPIGAIVTGITPFPVPNGTAGQQLTINGTGFPATQGTLILVYDNTVPSTGIVVNSWSTTQIKATLSVALTSGLPPGVPHTFGIWTPGHFPLVPPGAEAQGFIVVEGPPTLTSVAPASAAPNQTVTITGAGFGGSQGSTLFQLNGSNVAVASWSNTQITFVVPNATPLGAGTIAIGTAPYNVSGFFNVVAPLALPGGTHANQGQPVNITGSGFGATAGSLIYFSAAGLPVSMTVTDWSATSIYTNIPAAADLQAGFVYLILNGGTNESQIFSGFTIGLGSSGPATTAYVPGTTWVYSLNNTAYPVVTYQINGQVYVEQFPRGQIVKLTGDPSYDVDWITQINPVPLFSKISAPSTDLIALGPLTTATLNANGLIPQPPHLTSNTNLVLVPVAGSAGTSAQVTVSGSAPTPTGTVNLVLDGVTQIATGTLVAGAVTFAVSGGTFSLGAHTLTAEYQGDAKHLGSNSNPQTFTKTNILVNPAISVAWSALFIKDDGSQMATLTATVQNQLFGTVGVTNGMNTVTTSVDLHTILANGNSIVFASQPATPYTISSVNSSQIILQTAYTGTTNASTTVSYNLPEPTGTFHFLINNTFYQSAQPLSGSPPQATVTVTGGTSPAVDGQLQPGGVYGADLNYASGQPNSPTTAANLIVYSPTPVQNLSTTLQGTFNVQNGTAAVTSTVSQVGVLTNDVEVRFASDSGTDYTISPGTITSGGFSLTSNYTGTTNAATTAHVSVVETSGSESIPLLAILSCNESGGPVPTGSIQMYYNDPGHSTGWVSVGSSTSLTASFTQSVAQIVLAASSDPPYDSNSPGTYFAFSYTGDSHYNALPAPTGGPPPVNGDVNFAFIFLSAG